MGGRSTGRCRSALRHRGPPPPPEKTCASHSHFSPLHRTQCSEACDVVNTSDPLASCELVPSARGFVWDQLTRTLRLLLPQTTRHGPGTKSEPTAMHGPKKRSRLLCRCTRGSGHRTWMFCRRTILALAAEANVLSTARLRTQRRTLVNPSRSARLQWHWLFKCLKHRSSSGTDASQIGVETSVEDVFSNFDTEGSTILVDFAGRRFLDQDSVRRQDMTTKVQCGQRKTQPQVKFDRAQVI